MKKTTYFFFRVLIVLAITLTGAAAPNGYAKQSLQDSTPLYLELVDYWGGITGPVVVDENYAYLGQADKLRIIDISAPTDLRGVNFIVLPNDVTALTIHDDRLFVGWGWCKQEGYEYTCFGGVKVFQILPAAVLTEIGAFDLPGIAANITIDGNVAYVLWKSIDGSLTWGGLIAYDITDPAQPAAGGSDLTYWEPLSFELRDRYGYLTDDFNLYVFDLTDKLNPVQVNDHWTGWDVIAVSGDHILNAGSIFKTYNLVDPVNPALVASVETGEEVNAIALKDGHAYLAEGTRLSDYGGLRIMDVSDPAAPVHTGYIQLVNPAAALALQGDIAYVSMMYSGLVAVDVSDPTQPVVVGKYLTPGNTNRVLASNNRLMATTPYYRPEVSGFLTADLSGGIAPAGRGYLQHFDTRRLAVDGGAAYLLNVDTYSSGHINRVRMVDISDLSQPTIRSVYQLFIGGSSNDLAGGVGYLYLPQGQQIHVLDAHNLASVTPVAFIWTSGYIYDLAVVGDYLYVANAAALWVYNISNPVLPWFVGGCALTDGVRYLAVSGSYAYLAGAELLRVVDISNPAAPQLVSTIAAPTYIRNIDAEGGYVFMAVSEVHGVRVYDARDPAAPFEVASYLTPKAVWWVDVDNGHVYLAGGERGVYIFRFSPLANNVYLPLVQ